MDLTDLEIEASARAQAADIAASQQKKPGWQTMIQQLAVTLRLVQAPPPKNLKPGRELLLWSIKKTHDMSTALALVFELFQEASWTATVPSSGEIEIMQDIRKRPWNKAVEIWSKEQHKAYIWVQCHRQLLIKRQPPNTDMLLMCNDICVQHDAQTKQLAPVRQQKTWQITPQETDVLKELLPDITPEHLYRALAKPKAPEQQQRLSQTDTFISGGPLRASIEVYTQTQQPKNNKKPQEDANKAKALSDAILNLLKTNPPR